MRRRLEKKIVAMAVLYNNELQSVCDPVGAKFNVLREADSATTKAASLAFLFETTLPHICLIGMRTSFGLDRLCHFAIVSHRA